MTAKIIKFTGITKIDSDVDTILENNKGKLQGIVFCGWDMDGKFIAGSTYADGGTVLWLIEKLKERLMMSCPE